MEKNKINKLIEQAAKDPNLDETSYVRDLAATVHEISHQERMQRIKRRWQDVNELTQPDRAPVWCKPIGCWEELLPESSLFCVEDLRHDITEKCKRLTDSFFRFC